MNDSFFYIMDKKLPYLTYSPIIKNKGKYWYYQQEIFRKAIFLPCHDAQRHWS